MPWPQTEQYLELHQGTIVTYIDLIKHKMIEKSEVETKLPISFLQIHQLITKILRDNDILPLEEESKISKID